MSSNCRLIKNIADEVHAQTRLSGRLSR